MSALKLAMLLLLLWAPGIDGTRAAAKSPATAQPVYHAPENGKMHERQMAMTPNKKHRSHACRRIGRQLRFCLFAPVP